MNPTKNNNRIPRITLIAAMVVIGALQTLYSCSNSTTQTSTNEQLSNESNSESNTNAAGVAPGSNAPIDSMTPAGNITPSGTWALRCVLDDSGDAYVSKRAIFGESSFAEEITTHTDSSCLSNTSSTNKEYDAQFPAETTLTSLGEAKHINLTLKSIMIDGLSSQSTMLDVLQLQIYLIVDDRLYFGDSSTTDQNNNPANGTNRPATLNPRYYNAD